MRSTPVRLHKQKTTSEKIDDLLSIRDCAEYTHKIGFGLRAQ